MITLLNKKIATASAQNCFKLLGLGHFFLKIGDVTKVYIRIFMTRSESELDYLAGEGIILPKQYSAWICFRVNKTITTKWTKTGVDSYLRKSRSKYTKLHMLHILLFEPIAKKRFALYKKNIKKELSQYSIGHTLRGRKKRADPVLHYESNTLTITQLIEAVSVCVEKTVSSLNNKAKTDLDKIFVVEDKVIGGYNEKLGIFFKPKTKEQ